MRPFYKQKTNREALYKRNKSRSVDAPPLWRSISRVLCDKSMRFDDRFKYILYAEFVGFWAPLIPQIRTTKSMLGVKYELKYLVKIISETTPGPGKFDANKKNHLSLV